MPTEWTDVRLGAVVSLRKGVSYQGKYLDKPGPRLLGLGTIVPGGGARLDSARTYAGPLKSHHRIKRGEIYVALTDLTQEGAVLGSPAIVPDDGAGDFAVTHHVARVEELDKNALDRRFLYYVLCSREARVHMRAMATGTTVRAVAPRDAEEMPLALPPLAEQRAIASILGALDDKIELNRRMSETLEEMARALFRAWFAATHPAHTTPNGWSRSTLGYHVVAGRGLSYKGAGLSDGQGTPLLNLNSVLEGGGFKPEGLKFYVGDWKSRHAASPGDLLVANTEQGFDHLLIGYAALVPTWLSSNAIFSHHLYNVRPRSGSPLSRSWLLYALNASWLGEAVRRYSNGTTVNMLPPDAFVTPELNVPNERAVKEFDDFVGPGLRRTEHLYLESQTLAALRDALLPKLISGELRVPDAERLVSEVA